MAIAAAPAIAEAAPAVAGASEATGAASKAGSAAKGRSSTKAQVPGPKKPSTASKAASAVEKGAEAAGAGESAKSLMGKKSQTKKTSGKKFLNKVGNRKILLPELVACLVVLVFGTLVAPKGSKDDVHRMLVKGSALMAVFFILAIVSTGGKGPQKFANILGLLITLSYLLNSSDIHNVVNWVNGFFTKPKTKTPTASSGEPGTLPTSSTPSSPSTMEA